MKIRKKKLMTDILLIFIGAIIFIVGTIYRQLLEIKSNDIIYILKSLNLFYPILYLLFAFFLSIYRVYRFKKNN